MNIFYIFIFILFLCVVFEIINERKHPKKKGKYLILFVFFLSALDYLFTHYGVEKGIISEGNPVLVSTFTGVAINAVYFLLFAIGLGLTYLYAVSDRVKWITPLLYVSALPRLGVLFLHSIWIKYI